MKCDPPMFEYNRQLNHLPDLFLLERRMICMKTLERGYLKE